MSKTRENALFDELMIRLKSLGYTVYDYKQLDDVPYPFFEMEDTQTIFQPNKTDIKGVVIVTLSAWGTYKQRRQVSDMASVAFNEALAINKTESYHWALNTQASTIQVLDDTTTNTPLKRAVINLEFKLR
ncbi:phage capsid protein [Lactococcus garvieae]|uniref:phage capsid protein n=1 Tax=Lactococcus garvieae TaxID=1363 RepID=UPI003D77E402